MTIISYYVTKIGQALSRLPSLDPGWAALIAGVLALVAGILVYQSAMLSIYETQKQEKEKSLRRKLNLFLKAQHMAFILTDVAQLKQRSAWLEFATAGPDGNEIPGHLLPEQVYIARPRQLDDLWGDLSDFPPNAIDEIRTITRCFDSAEEYLKNTNLVPDGNQSPLISYYSSILDAARVLGTIMAEDELIKRHCIEDPDRNRILYGDNPE